MSLNYERFLFLRSRFPTYHTLHGRLKRQSNKDWQVIALKNITCQRHRLLIRCVCVLRAFVTFALNGTTVLVIDHLVGVEFGLDVVHGVVYFPLYKCTILYVHVGVYKNLSQTKQAL